MASLDFEGRQVPVETGDTVASALYRAGVRIFSRSFKYHRPRGLYCLTGDCANCLVDVDGEPCTRACLTPARAGQRVHRENAWPSTEFDVLSSLWYFRWLLPVGFYYKSMIHPRLWERVEPIIRRIAGIGQVPRDLPPAHREVCHHHPDVMVAGGGVAGLSAALAAAQSGSSVLLADEGAIGAGIAPGAERTRIDALLAQLRSQRTVTVMERATVTGVYEGPLVTVSAHDFMHHVHPQRIVVATGAVEEHTIFSGCDLPGILLGRAAARLAGVHRVPPGRVAVMAVATDEGIGHLETLSGAGVRIAAALVPERLASRVPAAVPTILGGRVVVARGRKGVTSVVVDSPAGRKVISCDTVVFSLGLVPRDGLLRQANGLPVLGAGDAVAPGLSMSEAEESGRRAGRGERVPDRPVQPAACGRAGFVCPCEDVTVADLEYAWDEGFRSTELLKRYSTVTMGPCQGALCHSPLRAFVHERTGAGLASAATTARPPARPVSLEDVSAGIHFATEQRTALHERHLGMGARMEWAGAWRRPQTYGDTLKEYWAVRRDVSVMDVGTLGKFVIGGRDATEFLERLYPCHVHDIRDERLRYALLLNEAGYLIDDGLICPTGGGRFYLTFTSSGAEQAEAWLRDWAETWNHRVHIVNQSAQLGAINVAGPRARELLARLSRDALDGNAFPQGRHREIDVAGVRCRAFRVGFVGELSFELHHPSSQSVRLWDALLAEGQGLGIVPHGLEVLRTLRLEKGHILIGQDTDFDTTPSKIGMDWAVKMAKKEFVGRAALERIGQTSMEQKLVSIAFQGPRAPLEGNVVRVDGSYVGYLTSSRFSPALGHGVALAWVRRRNGAFPSQVEADGISGTVTTGPFYDPKGERLRA